MEGGGKHPPPSATTRQRSPVLIGLTAQSAFLNNFENFVNRTVDIREDIKHHRDTLSYASRKVDYSLGENLFMLPSDMKLKKNYCRVQ